MKHKIIYQAEPEVQAPASLETQIKTAITTALNAQDIDLPCEINVLVTGSDGIQDINSTMRSVDQPTDVLSFPMFQLTPGDKPAPEDADPETGLIPLGDMVLSLNQARAQAQEYGHSLEREVSSPYTPSSTCWATTTWTKAPKKRRCGSGRRPLWHA